MNFLMEFLLKTVVFFRNYHSIFEDLFFDMLNIVMYHYVRNNEEFAYNCFSRRRSEFEKQVEHFSKKSTIVNPKDFDQIRFYLNSNDENGFLLTFDDGYKDHLYCAEYLLANDFSAIFFPPINIIKRSIRCKCNPLFDRSKRYKYTKLLDFIVQKLNQEFTDLY